MRTSLIETQQLEEWLLQKGEPSERLLTEAKIQIDSGLKEKAYWQAKTYEVLHLYAQEKLKNQIKEIENQLFSQPKYRTFQQRILSIFK